MEKEFTIKEKSDDFSRLVNFKTNSNKKFTIRKKIAKHGENSIIVIPELLRDELKPKTIVELKIKVLEESDSKLEAK